MAREYEGTVLIVDDKPTNLGVLFDCLNGAGYKVLVAQDGRSAIAQAERAQPDIILLDILMAGMDGYETCRRLKAAEATAEIPIIFMTALSETQDKVQAFEVGGVDYITKPFQHEEVLARVRTHLTLRRLRQDLEAQNRRLQQEIEAHQRARAQVRYLSEEIRSDHNFDEMVGRSAGLKRLLKQVELVAGTDSTVLIHGETGTGKELVARAIHNRSARSEQPLVKLNCAALPRELIESELFGHERGAFTGATQQRKGRFELADQGSIFLDEVGELPLEAQAKLLRVLQEQEFERVGGSHSIRVDVRVIAATNRDLAEQVREGGFRSDLFYRLNVFPLRVPPLRERKDDIPLLVRHRLEKLGPRLGRDFDGISEESLARLMDYAWPGNVRELENVIERAAILSPGPVVEVEPLGAGGEAPPAGAGDGASTLEEVERNHILRVLESTGGVIAGSRGAAAILGLKPSTLRSRMEKLGVTRTRGVRS